MLELYTEVNARQLGVLGVLLWVRFFRDKILYMIVQARSTAKTQMHQGRWKSSKKKAHFLSSLRGMGFDMGFDHDGQVSAC